MWDPMKGRTIRECLFQAKTRREKDYTGCSLSSSLWTIFLRTMCFYIYYQHILQITII